MTPEEAQKLLDILDCINDINPRVRDVLILKSVVRRIIAICVDVK